MIVTLAGGVGAARFLEGVVLFISPDVDIVTYTLAGIVEPVNGWGIAGDSTNTLGMLKQLGVDTWFLLGDRDLAVHIRRTELMRAGRTLAEISDEFRRALGVASQIIPMCNEPVSTHIDTDAGLMHFEHFLVQRRAQDAVRGVQFVGAAEAKPAPGVLEAIRDAEAILIAPSNPIVSVGTILAVPGVRAAIEGSAAPVVAVSPIVGGAAIKGPAAPMLTALGYEVSARGVAQCYAGLIDALVIDQVDAALADDIRAMGIDVVVTDTIMRGPDEKRALAQATLDAARRVAA